MQVSLIPVFAETVVPLNPVSVSAFNAGLRDAPPGERGAADAEGAGREAVDVCASMPARTWMTSVLRQVVLWLAERECSGVEESTVPAPNPVLHLRQDARGDSRRQFHLYPHEAADKYLRKFLKSNGGAFLRGVRRSGRYLPMIFRIFREEGLPEALAYLPAVESNFNPRARSPARAMGMWQFMITTARRFDLQVRYPWYDERLDPERSTRAAARLLAYLHDRYANWELALAAYNAGEGRVNRAMREARAEGQDPNYWNLDLPPQTRAYVPAFLAMAKLYSSPDAFGYPVDGREPPDTTESLEMDRASSLAEVAHRLEISLPELVRLNLAWRRGYIPDDLEHKVLLRVPFGLKERLLASLADNTPVRLPWLTHVVERKETLSRIARGYGVSMASIMMVNPIADRNFLGIGQILVIPLPPGDSVDNKQAAEKRAEYAPPPESVMHLHRVRKGETLRSISKRYGVSTKDLHRWNVKLALPVRPSQQMVVYLPREIPKNSVALRARRPS
ncbi:MAG: transglycosylase SLT domain-containing protein [SAR324 cluster bacterium]|nr:transglycosylase SLT domain-containing protein [SAR324 cluster bacterium]